MENTAVLLKKIMKLITLIRQGIPCLFYRATGIYCPGCGGTRAVKYLLEGKLLKSLWYHPLVGYVVLTVGFEIGKRLIFKRKRKNEPWLEKDSKRCDTRDGYLERGASFRNSRKKPDSYEMMVYIGIILILVNWAVKNWALLVLGVNLIP